MIARSATPRNCAPPGTAVPATPERPANGQHGRRCGRVGPSRRGRQLRPDKLKEVLTPMHAPIPLSSVALIKPLVHICAVLPVAGVIPAAVPAGRSTTPAGVSRLDRAAPSTPAL